MRMRVRVRLKGFFLVPKSHQHARAEVSSCLSFLDPHSISHLLASVMIHAEAKRELDVSSSLTGLGHVPG